ESKSVVEDQAETTVPAVSIKSKETEPATDSKAEETELTEETELVETSIAEEAGSAEASSNSQEGDTGNSNKDESGSPKDDAQTGASKVDDGSDADDDGGGDSADGGEENDAASEEPEIEKPRVQVYGSTVSGNRTYKKQAKELFTMLEANEIDFEFICIAADEQAKKYVRRKALGNMTIPQIYVDGELKGFFDDAFKANEIDELYEWLGLDEEPFEY
ncbi:hypothetical protein H4R23_006208, partial [Coemansia sp. Cherry 401B]